MLCRPEGSGMICLKYLKEKNTNQNSLPDKINTFIIEGERKNVPVIKTVLNYHEKRHIDQWNRIEFRNKPFNDQLINDKGAKNTGIFLVSIFSSVDNKILVHLFRF